MDKTYNGDILKCPSLNTEGCLYFKGVAWIMKGSTSTLACSSVCVCVCVCGCMQCRRYVRCVCVFVIYLREKSLDDDGILLVQLSDKQRWWKRRNMATRNETTKIARLVRREPIVCVRGGNH